MSNRLRSYALPALILALQGCRTGAPTPTTSLPADHSGAVSYAIVPTGPSGAYKLKRSEHAFGAQPIVNGPPVYPASLIGKQLPPVSIHAKAVIDDQGHVTELRDTDAVPTPEHAMFFAACREAVSHWQFSPMTVVDEFDDGKGNISQARTNTPFSLDYAFRFELVDGRPKVTPEH